VERHKLELVDLLMHDMKQDLAHIIRAKSSFYGHSIDNISHGLRPRTEGEAMRSVRPISDFTVGHLFPDRFPSGKLNAEQFFQDSALAPKGLVVSIYSAFKPLRTLTIFGPARRS
jgi:hypothetical protein